MTSTPIMFRTLAGAALLALTATGCAGTANDRPAPVIARPTIGSSVPVQPFAVAADAVGGPVETRSYPADALQRLRDMRWFSAEPGSDDTGVDGAYDRLWQLIRRFVGEAAFRHPASCLVVRTGADGEATGLQLTATAAVHEKVTELLHDLATADPHRGISSEVRLMHIAPGDVAQLGLNLQRIRGSLWGCVVLPGQRALLAERAHRVGRMISAPRITLFEAQRGNISVVNQAACIADYDLQVTDGTTVADPVIETLNSGLLIDVLGVPVGADTVLDVDLRLVAASESPATITLWHGGQVQLPDPLETRARTTTWLPVGATLVLLQPANGSDQLVCVLITAERVELSEPGD